VRVAGPLKGVRLLRGEGSSRRVDEWLDLAFYRGGPAAKGDLLALFDPAKKAWRDVRSTLALEHKARFEGGSGRATFERKLKVAWE
jgi:hypothetical protein